MYAMHGHNSPNGVRQPLRVMSEPSPPPTLTLNQRRFPDLFIQPNLVQISPYHNRITLLNRYPHRPNWINAYREVITNASKGKTEKDGGLDKADVKMLIAFARNRGVVISERRSSFEPR